MQFLVRMRDGESFTIEAAYIEVATAQASSYTFLGPVPGYSIAILAAIPVELVASVVPVDQAQGYVPPPGQGGADEAEPPKYPRSTRRELPQVSAADV